MLRHQNAGFSITPNNDTYLNKRNMLAPKEAAAVKSRWEAQKAKLKAKFEKLTDADLNFDASQKNEMLTKLQLKTGRTVKELQVVIETL
jgi:hypothetical protein